MKEIVTKLYEIEELPYAVRERIVRAKDRELYEVSCKDAVEKFRAKLEADGFSVLNILRDNTDVVFYGEFTPALMWKLLSGTGRVEHDLSPLVSTGRYTACITLIPSKGIVKWYAGHLSDTLDVAIAEPETVDFSVQSFRVILERWRSDKCFKLMGILKDAEAIVGTTDAFICAINSIKLSGKLFYEDGTEYSEEVKHV